MTAEVIIANSNGVALAADSAVTIGSKKIYNSAIKLFSLSKVEPIGIMIYGNATFLDVPWEILIKTFRKNLGSKKYETVEEYGEHFLKFLSNGDNFFPKQAQNNWLTTNVSGFYTFLRETLFEKTHPILKEKGKISFKETNSLLEEIINYQYNHLKQLPFIKGINNRFEIQLRKQKLNNFKKIREEVFEQIKLNKSLVKKLNDIAVFLHTRDVFPDNTSGIVLTGYGYTDIYPSIITYKLDGIINNKIKYKKIDKKCYLIKQGGDCAIIPFAQEDMVSTFMNGINPSLLILVENYLRQLFKRLPELLKEEDLQGNTEDFNRIRTEFNSDIEKLLIDFFKKLGDDIRINHSHPVINMVSVLPKDELATMAETLVNLTAFKRRITNTLETVGGPIDVAIISKGDGLVWVKRKHYFPREMNYHFFNNYFRGIENE